MSTLKVDTISEKTASNGITFSQDITATLSSSSNVKAPLNASGNAPVYACRAWVNFYGGPSTPYIRASGNVSSITDNGTGDYTVNFTTAMPDINYATGAQTNLTNTGSNWGYAVFERSRSTSAYRVMTATTDYTTYDCGYVSVSFIR